jgi:hypothetical protein
MNTNAILDIAIGLVLMYLVLSLVCTSLNEWISTAANLRASTLRTSLQSIIDDPAVRDVFYAHGLIQGSFAPSAKPTVATPVTAAAASSVATPPASDKGHPAYLSGATFAVALLDSLDASPQAKVMSFDDIRTAAEALPASNVRDLLVSNIALAGKEMDTLRTNLATSFDHMMDRTSGEYKKLIKWISLAVGLLVALALNADSIQVGKALWNDAALRAQMAQSAQEIAGTNGEVTCPAAQSGAGEAINRIRCAESTLRPLPVGWDQPTDLSLGSVLQKIGGLLMTAIALSLGAPFWFDLLSKFMQIRGTGQKPDRTEAQAQT